MPIKDLNSEELYNFLTSEALQPFSGWDFSYIKDRMVTAPLSWSYTSKILLKIRSVNSLLDIGTGGGELLSSLQPLPKYTCATEAHKPNIPIARKRLEPLGVKVYAFEDDDELPFEDGQFELIINRHSSFSPKEVFRILKPGGQFITQQVGGTNDLDLNRLLGARENDANFKMSYWNLEHVIKQLEEERFQILERKEAFPITRCFDVGAIAFHLKAIPWQIPDFSVEKYFDELKKIHLEIQKKGYIDITSHRFFIIAQKG